MATTGTHFLIMLFIVGVVLPTSKRQISHSHTMDTDTHILIGMSFFIGFLVAVFVMYKLRSRDQPGYQPNGNASTLVAHFQDLHISECGNAGALPDLAVDPAFKDQRIAALNTQTQNRMISYNGFEGARADTGIRFGTPSMSAQYGDFSAGNHAFTRHSNNQALNNQAAYGAKVQHPLPTPNVENRLEVARQTPLKEDEDDYHSF